MSAIDIMALASYRLSVAKIGVQSALMMNAGPMAESCMQMALSELYQAEADMLGVQILARDLAKAENVVTPFPSPEPEAPAERGVDFGPHGR